MLARQDLLNSGTAGVYRCVYTNVATVQPMREDTLKAMRAMLGELGARAKSTLGENCLGELWPGILETSGPGGVLQEALAQWAEADRKKLVLLIDEIDTLPGDTLLAVLRQAEGGEKGHSPMGDVITLSFTVVTAPVNMNLPGR